MYKRFQESLDRVKTINLDRVLDLLDCEEACNISDYGIHDYPNLEMSRDINTLQELVSKVVPKDVVEVISSTGNCRYYCSNCTSLIRKNTYKFCPFCSARLKYRWN